MTKRDILIAPQILDYKDIMKIFGCGRCKALDIIRGIKSVSDKAGLKGKVTLSDYVIWFNKGVVLGKEKESLNEIANPQ